MIKFVIIGVLVIWFLEVTNTIYKNFFGDKK